MENPKYSNYSEFVNKAITQKYKEVAKDMLKRSFPLLTDAELDSAINYAISLSFFNSPAKIVNNYTKQEIETSLMDTTEFIQNKKPIITSYGVMFKHHGTVDNPLYSMIDGFIKKRKQIKKKMFSYPKGSSEFARWNLAQLLEKLNANGLYGAIGQSTCIFYNLAIAATVTRCGRSANSAASLFFESFLDNNVPFGSMNELVTFIYNVTNEPNNLKDEDVLDKPIDICDVFAKLIYGAGFGWIPSEKEMEIVWEILCSCTQENLNRLYYKNNLINFISENSQVNQSIVYCLQQLKAPFMDPNNPPEEIKDTLDAIYNLFYEYVYYKEQIIDRLDKMEALVRNVSIIQDTDSSIVSLDGLYRFMLDYCKGVPMNIKVKEVDLAEYLVEGEVNARSIKDRISDYDFENEEIIERDRLINPMVFIPQDGLRYSIINIFAYCITLLVNDYMVRYTKNSNSFDEKTHGCFLILKNEFLFKRVLVAKEAKKHYASKMELQEGNIIPNTPQASLDIKGLDVFKKTSIAESVRERLKIILYEDILDAPYIDPVKVNKDLAIVEREIYESIERGEKKFYKPVKIRSLNGYDNPFRIQGIKAAYAYNKIREPNTEAFDLSQRNSIDIVKVNIDLNNIDRIKDEFPGVYSRASMLMQTPEFKGKIDAIAIPLNEPVPKWILPFVNYSTIINDSISLFPLESIGNFRGGSSNNYTNMIQI